jgi:excisionase family DNA binding protein
MTRYLTVVEAAEILGVSRQQAWNLLESGELRTVRRRVLRRSDVERLAAKRKREKERKETERARRAAIEAATKKAKEQFDTQGGEVDGDSGAGTESR